MSGYVLQVQKQGPVVHTDKSSVDYTGRKDSIRLRWKRGVLDNAERSYLQLLEM